MACSVQRSAALLWRCAGDHLLQHHCEGEDTRARIGRPAARLLARHVRDHRRSVTNTRSALGETPLINVVRGAAAEVAKEPVAAARQLLERGADPNVLAYDGCNRLHQAIIHSNVDLVRLFLASAQIHEFGSSIRRVTKTHSSWQRPAGPGDPTSVSVKFSMCWRDFQKRRSTSDEAEPATGPLRGWCVAQLREGVCYAAGDACQTGVCKPRNPGRMSPRRRG